ncbi:hypothetical protein [Miniimonas sp. S16]|uniref:hypothetical protein n=1 Tax=Miniimonas sp. S16 TaxID=2171623 RepID=UPI0018FF4577|nr:hypothetical protein [Miniimonas sp. S16]
MVSRPATVGSPSGASRSGVERPARHEVPDGVAHLRAQGHPARGVGEGDGEAELAVARPVRADPRHLVTEPGMGYRFVREGR